MSDIQIPNRQPPQATPPAPPYDLVGAYLNRPYQNAAIVSGALDKILAYNQEQQKLKAGAFEAGGPYLMNMLYGGGQQPQQTSSQPQSGASVPSNAPASPQGTAQTLYNSPIEASVSGMGHPDFTGHLSKIRDLQTQMGQYQGMGKYGRNQQEGLGNQLTAEKNAMDAEQAPLNYAEKKQSLSNAKQQIPMEIGKGSAQQADEFTKSDVKTKSGFAAFQQLEDAWNKVPSPQKGSYVGILSRHAGDFSSKRFPEAAAYNKLREGLIGAIVAGIDPMGRQGPSLLAQMEKAVPTLQTDEKSRKILMASLYKQLVSQSEGNYEGYNNAAKSFGGSIPKPKIPHYYSQTATNKTGHKIGSNDGQTWYDVQTGEPVQ